MAHTDVATFHADKVLVSPHTQLRSVLDFKNIRRQNVA